MKKAFTLIELLVVIAVVGVLAGTLMPVLAAAKRSASRAISIQSLNQLSVGARLYLNDNNDTFWPYEKLLPTGTQWWFGFETTQSVGLPEGQRTCDYSQGPLGPYTMTAGGVKEDPAFLQYSPRLKPKYKDGNYGYGYNTELAADSSGNARNTSQVTYPSQMIVFATCAQVNTFQAPASSSHPMIEEFYMVNSTTTSAHFRHGKQALAAFLDGSVRPLDMATDMLPGSLDSRIPTANIGRFQTAYVKQTGW